VAGGSGLTVGTLPRTGAGAAREIVARAFTL
jgi:hypothetical protein